MGNPRREEEKMKISEIVLDSKTAFKFSKERTKLHCN